MIFISRLIVESQIFRTDCYLYPLVPCRSCLFIVVQNTMHTSFLPRTTSTEQKISKNDVASWGIRTPAGKPYENATLVERGNYLKYSLSHAP